MTLDEIEEMQRVTGYDLDGFLFWAAPRQRVHVGDRLGCLGSGGYVRTTIAGKCVTLHRAIWAWHHGYWPRLQIDHVNRIRHDNRIENLREVTPAQNSQNNGAKGCYFHAARQKWMAKIQFNGVRKYLGSFDNESDARSAYLKAKHEARTQ